MGNARTPSPSVTSSSKSGSPPTSVPSSPESTLETKNAETLIVESIANLLNDVIRQNDERQIPTTSPLFCFSSLHPAKISILNYCQRIQKYLFLKKEDYEQEENVKKEVEMVFIVALIYIDRCLGAHEELSITSYTAYRLMAAALLSASKVYADNYYDNEDTSKILGIHNSELNNLELVFLKAINFDLLVCKELYEQCVAEIKARHPLTKKPLDDRDHLVVPSLMSVASIYTQLSSQIPSSPKIPISTPSLPSFTIYEPVLPEPPDEEESKESSQCASMSKTIPESPATPLKTNQCSKPSLPYGFYGQRPQQIDTRAQSIVRSMLDLH